MITPNIRTTLQNFKQSSADPVSVCKYDLQSKLYGQRYKHWKMVM